MRRTLLHAAALCCFALGTACAHAAGAIGPAALKSRHTALAPQLARNAFGGPLVLQSEEAGRRIEGEVYALIDHPFSEVAGELEQPAAWCEILILHLNTKACTIVDPGGRKQVDVRVGKKELQPPEQASLLSFSWEGASRRADYLAVQMSAEDGPYDTHEYRILAEAVPVDAGHTFLHMGYAFSYGGASSIAMRVYLATVARNKVGFTRVDDKYVGGVRGIAERNTMRYFLAIDAYLDSLATPREQQVDKRMTQWFDGTEKYARQLHEMERDDYLAMKREEVRRHRAAAR